MVSLIFGYLWYYLFIVYVVNDDGDKENIVGSECCKGCFVLRGYLSVVKKLVKGKDNLKWFIVEEYNGERDYELIEKKVIWLK